MIKYDYLIDRLTEKRKFGPVKPFANMHNFSVIRGKNAIGKSTLLHLLAYAFYGYDERSFKGQGNQINPVLKDKIYQFQSKDQTVKFNFELTDEVSGLRICSDKSDKEDFPGVYELAKDGKKAFLSYEKFTQKYCVIYDIPDKPTDRISNLVEDVKVINDKLVDKLDSFSDHLSRIFAAISDSQDPRRIEALQADIEEYGVKLEPLKKNKLEIDDTVRLLDLLILKYEYISLQKKIEEKQAKIDLLKSKKSRNGKEVKQRQRLIAAIKSHYDKLYHLLAKAVLDSAQVRDISGTEQFKRLKATAKDKIKMNNWDWTDELPQQLRDYLKFLDNIYSQYSLDHKVADIYEQLLALLGELDRTGESIPKVKMPELIQSVKDMISKHTEEKNIAQNIKNISDSIEQAILYVTYFTDAVEDLGEDSSALYNSFEVEDVGDYRQLISEMQGELDRLIKQKESVKLSMAKADLSVDDDDEIPILIRKTYPHKFEKFRTKGHVELIDLKKEHLQKSHDQDTAIKDLEIKLHVAQMELDKLRKKEKHPLLDKKDLINAIHNRTLDLKSDINEYNDYFEILRSGNQQVTEKIQFYNKSISKYFARKLGRIPYIDDHVEVKEVDYLNKQFVLAGSGLVVKFDYFSTGQAQCIYIKSLLNQNMDKKVILLLDEISSMDDETLGIIYDEIKEKRRTGNILAAILAEKSNDKPSAEVL